MIKIFLNLKRWGIKKTIFLTKIFLRKSFFVHREFFLNKNSKEVSYSQYAEDLFIDRFLGYPKQGFYVDVGANQPTYLNNTKRFYERGWSGINIEPDANNFDLLEKERPRDTNLNIGVSNVEDEITLYVCEESTLSTFSRETAEKLSREGHEIVEERKIGVFKLSSIFKKFEVEEIDFMTIDTEGYDQEVLMSNDWDNFRPKLICIEDNGGNEHDAFFKTKNYKKVGFNGLNSFFADTL